MQTAFRSEETFTQAEFAAWLEGLRPGDAHRYELLGGRIVMTPPAALAHGDLEARIVTALSLYAKPRGLGRVFGSSAGFELPSGDTVQPDCSFVSADRLAAGPEPGTSGFGRIVPDLVVEVLSPSTERRDRTEKKDVYEACGVGEYWLVDASRAEVTVYWRDGDRFSAPRMIRSGRIESRILAGIDVVVEELFASVA